ncbi:hypothetical protein BDN71DRAFT_1430406 [Pleurotus eryngii]|uniref:Uncharacterized protein n=1 Tax=Pleurotus eryngii TaxID=5323 RepID=A0A9P5ZZ35_PLEER|nr:hypothetical protein BDN71DRAFT_1430406 [Pleurotus eryngii]
MYTLVHPLVNFSKLKCWFTSLVLAADPLSVRNLLEIVFYSDIGFIFLEHGLTVGEVVVLYVKGGSKNGQHASQLEAFNIAAMSWIGFKVYDHVYGHQFINIMDTTSHFLNNMERELTEEGWEVYKQRDASKVKLAKSSCEAFTSPGELVGGLISNFGHFGNLRRPEPKIWTNHEARRASSEK